MALMAAYAVAAAMFAMVVRGEIRVRDVTPEAALAAQ
jgi:hypothetical protein